MPETLPPNPYHIGPWHDAYERCLSMERRSNQIPILEKGASAIVSARFKLLGYLMQALPLDPGRDHLAEEITGCKDDHQYLELAQWLISVYVSVLVLA